jgi:5-methyltetrahydrofolate--homocysteine methyltransferase
LSELKIIGEKINGTRRQVARAIEQRDAAVIRDLAVRQAEAGAAWLDVNAGTRSSAEPDDLVWLIETVQAAVDVPLCLDSANPLAVAAGLHVVERIPMVNSISGEPQRLEGILPLVAESGCSVIVLTMDGTGIPATCERRLEVGRRLIAETRARGVPDDRVYLDPLAMTLATKTDGAQITLDTIRALRREFPEAHLTMGLSNVSFGLPARSYINRAFLTLALAAGLDSAILDPLDRETMAALVAAELVLGRDRHCLNYTRAYRAGLFARPETMAGSA